MQNLSSSKQPTNTNNQQEPMSKAAVAAKLNGVLDERYMLDIQKAILSPTEDPYVARLKLAVKKCVERLPAPAQERDQFRFTLQHAIYTELQEIAKAVSDVNTPIYMVCQVIIRYNEQEGVQELMQDLAIADGHFSKIKGLALRKSYPWWTVQS